MPLSFSAINFLFHFCGNLILHDKNSCCTVSDFKNVCVVLVIFTKMNCMSNLAKGKGTTFSCTEYMYTKCLDRFTVHVYCDLVIIHKNSPQEFPSSAILKQQFLFFCFVIFIVWDHSHFCKDLHIKAKTLYAYGSSKLLFVLNV